MLWDIGGTVLGTILAAAAIGLCAWMHKSYERFCSMDANLRHINGRLGETRQLTDRHEVRLDGHDHEIAWLRGRDSVGRRETGEPG